jgi:hypothetical protein
MAAQQCSHGVDDAHEGFRTQIAAEAAIRQEFPEE